jgi:AraC-like DNA-binding protein
MPNATPVINVCINTTLSDRYLELVESNNSARKSVSDYARELCITPNHLNKIVKDQTGLTARQHIQKKIIAAATRELSIRENSMKQVAAQLGFEDLSHFSKFFKKATGYNFSRLRQSQVYQMEIAKSRA